MCGIAGVFASDEEVVRQALPLIVSAQHHRGPNDGGEIYLPVPGGTLGLGHRRLSILDLSPLGHQPMVDAESGDVLVYNGELYNFRDIRADLEREGCTFRSDGDTEVMLRALSRWGTDALHRFEGMYALAWFRKRQMTVVLARDPVGIKPLYYARSARGLVFGSEVRAVLASGLVRRTIAARGVAGMLAYGAVQEPYSFFRDVVPVGSGSIAEIRLALPPGSTPIRPRRFWQFPPPDPEIMETEALDVLRSSLDEAVRQHLVSDVPVGVFLSSGIDSTIIAGLAAKHAPGIQSFTVAFGDNPDMSEGTLAAATAQRIGIEHHDIQISNQSSLHATEPWLDAQDQPSMDGLNVYLVAQAVRRRGITVALSGQGGDEIFGGYPSFADVPRYMRMMRVIRTVPMPMRPMIARLLALRSSEASRQKLIDMLGSDGSALQLALARRRVLSSHALAQLGLKAGRLGLDQSFLSPGALAELPVSNHFPIHSVSLAETRFYMGNMLLRDCDANGMAHSLEIRVPFLDQRVINTFLAVTGHIRLPNGGCDKHLLRKAFASMLSSDIISQPKVGFILPIKRWMAGPLRDRCEQSLAYLKRSGIVVPEGVDRVWSAYLRAPESPMWSRAWSLVVLGAYAERTSAECDATDPAHIQSRTKRRTDPPRRVATPAGSKA